MKAYKVTDKDLQCRNYQYAIGKTYIENRPIEPCECGFHACITLNDCFSYKSFKPTNRVFEVDCKGTIKNEGDKIVCSEITFLKELSWETVLELVNIGTRNKGMNNIGNDNTGNSNLGNGNTGVANNGTNNKGNYNRGSFNTGDHNIGYNNSGRVNSGDYNSGYYNIGDYNSGAYNIGNFNSIVSTTITVFNKPCERALWQEVYKPEFLMQLEIVEYDIAIPFKVAFKKAFDTRSPGDIAYLKELPNFDSKIFEEITGIDITKYTNEDDE